MYGHQCDAAARRTTTGGDEHGRAWSPALLSLAGGASSSPAGVPADSRRWYRRELEITVRFGRSHPHIVTVLDTGVTGGADPLAYAHGQGVLRHPQVVPNRSAV
jgi:hypothetical protein